MTEVYWIFQFLAVAAVYGFVMFVWPSVVFGKFLNGKSRTFRFAFCTLGMVLFVNFAVLVIGLIPHALNRWLVTALFYGIFAVVIWRRSKNIRGRIWTALRHLSAGTMKKRSFFGFLARLIGDGFCFLRRKWHDFFHGHLVEYGILIFLCLYAVLYFSWGAFDLHSFGTFDMYVHHSWINGLQNGTIFSSGIYPEGMHTLIYLMSSVSGVRVYSFLLYLDGIHSAVLILSMWIFLKEVFHWKYSPVLAVLLFLILEQNSLNDIYAMSRIQWTLPEEFALYAEFLCGAFFLRFLKDASWEPQKNGLRGSIRYCGKNENLLLFAMAVAASFATHFYVTIMAAIVCIGIIISRPFTFFRKKRCLAVLAAAVLAVFITASPMAAAFAEGHPLQGSLTWALEVMQGGNSDSSDSSDSDVTSDAETDSEETETEGQEKSASPDAADADSGDTASGAAAGTAADTGSGEDSAKIARQGVGSAGIGKIGSSVIRILSVLYTNGFLVVYGEIKGRIYAGFVFGILFFGILAKIALTAVRYLFRRGRPDIPDGAVAVSATALLFLLDVTAHSAGLPQIVDGPRLLASTRLMIFASCVALPDFFFAFLERQVRRHAGTEKGRRIFRDISGAVLTAGLFLAVILSGEYHGYLYYSQSRYPEAVNTVNRIIHENEPFTYTLVSTTDELYQVNRYGYHEELLTLVKEVESTEDYSLPSSKIFLFIEKKPLRYGTTCFFRGPSALAVTGKYYQLFRDYNTICSQSPDILSGEISEQKADEELRYAIGDSDAAEDPDGRVILESKAMRWLKKFQEMYPYESSVYFEDEYFVCYQLTQDPEIPYKLGFFDS